MAHTVIFSEYAVIGRWLFFLVLLVVFTLWSHKFRDTLRVPSYYALLVSLTLLVVAQSLDLYALFQSSVNASWPQFSYLISGLFALSVLLICLTFLDVIWLSHKRIVNKLDNDDQGNWLHRVYEKIPAAVFILKEGELQYGNGEFVKLQAVFQKKNPFEHCHLDEQEVWLQNNKGERFAYWVAQFPMLDKHFCAYVVSDITNTKLQRDLIARVSQDQYHHGEKSLKEILNSISVLLPDSLIYVARKDGAENKYTYLHHLGAGSDIDVYSELLLQQPLNLKNGHWSWSTREGLQAFNTIEFVKHYAPTQIGGMSLCNEEGEELGVILVLQKTFKKISPMIQSFLSIFSFHVRFEMEHIQDKKRLDKSTDRYRTFLNRSSEAIVDIDIEAGIAMEDGFDRQWQCLLSHAKVKEFNPVFSNLFNIHGDMDIENILNIRSLKHVMTYVFQSGFGSEPIEVAHELQGSPLCWISCSVIADIEDNNVLSLRLIARDITQSKMHIQNLEFQNKHDLLTSLPNRLAVRETVDEKIEQALQFGFKMALLLIDLDRFKEVNDTLGHHYGDVLLKKIGPRITPLLAQYRASLARLGGDEFAVVIPSFQSDMEAHSLARSILKKLREPFDLGQLTVEIGASVGISQYPKDGTDTGALLRCADVAMYQAKKHPNSILDYSQEMDENSPRRLALMAAMGRGIEEKQFFLQFQPKLTLSGNSIRGAEALIRWQHPEMGLVNPGEFIPMAELSDVIIPMTHWVIEEALNHIQQWLKQGQSVKVSVNVSTRNLLDESLWGFIADKLQ
jgi:diguanylate cyclase (GGDEF)-like protein